MRSLMDTFVHLSYDLLRPPAIDVHEGDPLNVRLDIRQTYPSFRLRITSPHGPLQGDEIRRVMRLIEESDEPLMAEIQNNGLEITALGDNEERGVTEKRALDEDELDAITVIKEGRPIRHAIASTNREFVRDYLADLSFSAVQVVVVLTDNRPAEITGFDPDRPACFQVSRMPEGDGPLSWITLEQISHVDTRQ